VCVGGAEEVVLVLLLEASGETLGLALRSPFGRSFSGRDMIVDAGRVDTSKALSLWTCEIGKGD
jgi:hypothetical protein